MQLMRLTFLFVITSLIFTACGGDGNQMAESASDRPVMKEADAPPKTQLDKDIEIIQDFMRENGITGDRTASGLHYVITQEGTGERAQAGHTVSVHYTGYLLDGTKFDSSVDRGQPFEFTLGQGMVIQGWDEGIALLKVGSQATLFIPSSLGYGERGAGALIGSNEVLIFDVKLLGVR